MLKRSSFVLSSRQRGLRYPSLVSYNKVPWKMLAADAPELHHAVAGHYTQLLTLATTTDIPHILNDFHLDIPQEQWHAVLPSTVYIIPSIASSMGNDPNEFGPYNWSCQHVTDSVSLQYYAPLEAAVGTTISDVITYKSPDLRVICNAVVFRPSSASVMSKMNISPNSTLYKLVDMNGGVEGARAMPDFTLFHFFRPNRPQSEITSPLQKYFRNNLPYSNNNNNNNIVAAVEMFGLSSKWEPLLEQTNSSKTTRLSSPKAFRPPTSYLPGLYERLAIKPGNAFGRRSQMWGTYF